MLSLNWEPIALAVLGLGGVLVGLVELGLGCVRRFPTWKISLGVAAVLGAAGGVAYACGEGVTFGQPALVLGGALLVLLLFRSRHSIGGNALVQGGLLIVAGGVAVGYATYRLEQGLEADLLDSDFALELMADPIEENSPPARLARTDSGTTVPLFEVSPSAASPTQDREARYVRNLRLDAKLIQTSAADLKYNCHGWVFTGGRYWVRGAAVETILKENGYKAVEHPRAGDVAIFRNHLGEVTHTGLVRAGNRRGTILIESKWGRFGRYVHGPDEHGYRGHAVTYYHTSRGTHLLAGMDDSAPDASVPVSGE